jgi:hypothetical protein
MSTFSLNINPYYDDVNSHYLQNKPTREGLESGSRILGRNATSYTNIIGVLDAVSSDLQVALGIAMDSSTVATPSTISTGGLLECPGGQNTTCKTEEMRMTIPESGTTYSNGSYVLVSGAGPFLAPIERSLLNMFTVLQDAYQYA